MIELANFSIAGQSRILNSSTKRYRRADDSEDKQKFITKGESISNSMSRMIRSSPKIHLKHQIHNNTLSNSVKKAPGFSSSFQNKLHLNKYEPEAGIVTESSRNQKLENLLQKHVLKPVRTTSASRATGKLLLLNNKI